MPKNVIEMIFIEIKISLLWNSQFYQGAGEFENIVMAYH